MENDKIRIKLDSPENTYFSGQVIKGQITIVLVKTTDLNSIKFKIRGKGKCKWVDLSRVRDKRDVVLKYQTTFVNDTGTVVKDANQLPSGDHSFTFEYKLPNVIPSSFRGKFGYIKYVLKIIVDKSWHLKERYFLPLTIIQVVTIDHFHLKWTQNEYRQITKTIGVFDSKPITLSAELPFAYGVRDCEMDLNVTVDNRSKVYIDKCKFSIIKIVTYNTNGCSKHEEMKIYKKETGGIDKQSTRQFAYKLPVKGEPQIVGIVDFINISYEIRVHIMFNRLLWNPISVVLPFIVITDPPQHTNHLPPYPSGIQNVSIYSNSSVDSPSRSQYSANETISSLTSNSSGATLSPATFLRPPYYPHQNHSASSSARSSLRLQDDSITDDLPSAPSDSLEYDSDSEDATATNAGWNRPAIPSNYSTPSRNRTDLPPSYDELFGDSTANGGVAMKI